MMNIWLSRLHNSNSVSLQLFVNSQTPRLESVWGLKGGEGSREHTSSCKFQLRRENVNGFSLSTCCHNGLGGMERQRVKMKEAFRRWEEFWCESL